MRVVATFVAMTVSLAATPVIARELDSGTQMHRFLIEEYSLAERSGSDAEKLRTARYGLRDPIDDDYESVPDSTRVRWKLNRFKMRVPLDTSALR